MNEVDRQQIVRTHNETTHYSQSLQLQSTIYTHRSKPRLNSADLNTITLVMRRTRGALKARTDQPGLAIADRKPADFSNGHVSHIPCAKLRNAFRDSGPRLAKVCLPLPNLPQVSASRSGPAVLQARNSTSFHSGAQTTKMTSKGLVNV